MVSALPFFGVSRFLGKEHPLSIAVLALEAIQNLEATARNARSTFDRLAARAACLSIARPASHRQSDSRRTSGILLPVLRRDVRPRGASNG